MLWFSVVITSILAGLGVAGRGAWSITLAGLFSFVTIVLIGYSFFSVGLVKGLLLLLIALLMFNLSEKIFRKMIGTNKRPSFFDAHEENREAQKEIDDLLRKVRDK